MRRREFIAGLGGAAAWPLAVRVASQMTVSGDDLNARPVARPGELAATYHEQRLNWD
jgi:hypothetical protein